MSDFWVENAPFTSKKKSLVKTIKITSIYILTAFSVQILKKSLEGIQSYEDRAFLDPNWSICPKQKLFLEKIINTIFIYLLTAFIVQSFKKFLQWIQSYEAMPFLDPKWLYLPKRDFFFTEKPCSYHSCLSTSQKLNSDINLIMTFWGLQNTEISLAKSHFSV